jgi:nitrile hydratase alpha subunit
MSHDPHDHDHDHDHSHDHDHDHDHARTVQPDDTSEPSAYELKILAISELLVDKGVLTPDQIRRSLEKLDSWQPARGAEIIARAWTDPAFKERLLADGNKAIAEFGLNMGDARLTVVENTPAVQNVIVCTLCSCYPRAVLGLPPDWYRSKNYRARVVKEPRKVLAEFGTVLSDSVTVRVHDSLAELRYLVLPERPAATADWSAEQLAAIVTRDCMVGVVNPAV